MAYADPAKRAEWEEVNRKRLRAYKREKAREYRERSGDAYYAANADAIKARAKANYLAKQPSVSAAELERLQLPENRLEAVAYGPQGLQICLECGRVCSNLSRHTSSCPVRPQSSAEYRKRWGYARSNPLASAAWSAGRSAASKTEAAQAARRENREEALANLAAGREANRHPGRGKWRQETRQRRAGEIRHRRPRAHKVPDHEVLAVLGRGFPLAASAELAGLSQTAFYSRVQRLDPAHFPKVREQRRTVNRTIFDLRAWLWSLPAVPTPDQALGWISGQVENGDSLALAFIPYLAALRGELRADPKALARLGQRVPASGGAKTRALVLGSAAIALAAKVFKRARKLHQAGGRAKGAPEQKSEWKIGARVEEVLTPPTFVKLCQEFADALEGGDTQANAAKAMLRRGFTAKQINAAIAAKINRPVVAARHFVLAELNHALAADEKALEYDTVAAYHKRWLQHARKRPRPPA